MVSTDTLSGFCPNYSLVAVGKGDSGAILTRLRCKRWSCDYCAYVNRVQWRMRIQRTIPTLDTPIAFVTLTLKPLKTDEHGGLDRLRHGSNKLLKRMRRSNLYGDMPYVRTLERQQNGHWHAHYLIGWRTYDYGMTFNRRRIRTAQQLNRANRRWLKDNAASCGLGHQADYRAIGAGDIVSADTISYLPDDEATGDEIAKVTGYITKYMSKEIQENVEADRPPHMRIVQASRHFDRSKRLSDDLEELHFVVMYYLTLRNYIELNLPIRDIQRQADIKLRDFVWIPGTDISDTRNTLYPDEKYVSIDRKENLE